MIALLVIGGGIAGGKGMSNKNIDKASHEITLQICNNPKVYLAQEIIQQDTRIIHFKTIEGEQISFKGDYISKEIKK